MALNISSEEQAVLEELKRRTIDCVTPKMLEDNYLFYRFAKARNFNLAEAEFMLRKNAYCRKEFGVDTILTDYTAPEEYNGTKSVAENRGTYNRRNSHSTVQIRSLRHLGDRPQIDEVENYFGPSRFTESR
ncbi:hypothetical protein AVEN_139993-1 [Araneus ventricosus]|uniref:CRAL/TRIO N-terminal domain-containing protein n=1 Tax=Araneus ventricosus TaxID=182803 RepID=A0A4Y2NGF0_ARAVE|nr:hypothetical protein AVEN_139993-1 [Araneus ventricosus]